MKKRRKIFYLTKVIVFRLHSQKQIKIFQEVSMKNITKIVAFFLLVCLCLPLFSCSDGTMDSDGTDNIGTDDVEPREPEYVEGSMDGIVFDDIYYYKTNRGFLRYYDLTDIEAGSFSANSDPLVDGTHSGNPASVAGSFFVVSPKLTDENNGNHVLIVLNNAYLDYARLYTYDLSANKATFLSEEISKNVQSLDVYEDKIIYTINNGNEGWDIYIIDDDGKNHIMKDNSRKAMYRVVTVYNDRIYYVDERLGILYSDSLTFDDEQKLFSIGVTSIYPFIVDGYIVYAPPNPSYVEYEGRRYIGYDLYRRPLDDIEEKELMLENVCGARLCGDRFFYVFTEPYRNTESIVSYMPSLYEYSFETDETRKLYDLNGTKRTRAWQVISEDWLVLIDIDYSTGDTFQTRTDTTIVLNLATGEETVLPEE